MPLPAGTRLGPYEIVSLLGSGGMGEVHRARDTRPAMARDVAIKILAGAGADADSRRRFEQEARAMSALNHPHLLAIYDVGVHEGRLYLVEELLEGRTLREVLASGPVPPRRAVDYARAIAEGLAAAHARGIVHRDLKPENVMLTADGRIKILDFGIAKLQQLETASTTTTEAQLTGPGTIVGTIAYMSPEQVRGRVLDGRSDIFSLGIVLYEMLDGARPFAGDTPADTQSAILNAEARDLPVAQRAIPTALERIVRRCLEKQPEQRFQSASDLAFALEAMSTVSSGHAGVAAAPAPPPPSAAGRERLAWTAAALFALAAAGAGLWAFAQRGSRDATPAAPSARFTITTPTVAPVGSVPFFVSAPFTAVSPDGRQIAYAMPVQMAGTAVLWVRPLDQAPRPLDGTEGAAAPFWSPDSTRIAFFAQGKLKIIGSDGSNLRVVADAAAALGGDWNADDVILFPGPEGSGMNRVAARGGKVTAVTELDAARGEVQQTNPRFLPDGHRFLYWSAVANDGAIYLGSLEGGAPRRLLRSSSKLEIANGHVLSVEGGRLVARAFDAATATIGDDAVQLMDSVPSNVLNGMAPFSVSDGGTLVVRTVRPNPFQMIWSDRTGGRGASVGDPGPWAQLALAPDDRRVAVQRAQGAASEVWLFDLDRGAGARLTMTGNSHGPVFSRDGSQLAFRSDRKGADEIYRRSFGAGEVSRWEQAPSGRLEDWSADGRYLLLYEVASRRLLGVDVREAAAPVVVTTAASTDLNDEAQFSPDGRWVSYNSTTPEGDEIFLQPFPGPGDPIPVSVGGGRQAKWRADGRELFYLAIDGTMMTVDIATSPSFRIGRPKPLFRTRLTTPANSLDQYAVTRDGQRFLILEPETAVEPESLTVMTNWTNLLKK